VIRAPKGRLTLSTDFLVQDKGEPDATAPQANQHALEDLPVDVLVYLLVDRVREGIPFGPNACESGACEPEFPSLSRPPIAAA
jgi:hypothetical protein